GVQGQNAVNHAAVVEQLPVRLVIGVDLVLEGGDRLLLGGGRVRQAQVLPDLLALGVVDDIVPGRPTGVHDRPGGHVEGDIPACRDDLADLEVGVALGHVDVPERGDVDNPL